MAFLTVVTILLGVICLQANALHNSFYAYYFYLWGNDHFSVDPSGTEAQLKLDKSSGAGFRSKLDYQFGMFHIRMKIPDKKTEGIVTSFYLTNLQDALHPVDHIELNYEFLGTNGTVRTNIYDNDMGHRIQVFNLWFDPSKDYHTYEILWNSYQIVYLVDGIPIRVFKNNTAQGVAYLMKPMHIEATIWDNSTSGSSGAVNWSNGPFVANFQDFGFYACSDEQANNFSKCASDGQLWNQPSYRQLSDAQKQQMAYYRNKYLTYDYCLDQSTRKKECSLVN